MKAPKHLDSYPMLFFELVSLIHETPKREISLTGEPKKISKIYFQWLGFVRALEREQHKELPRARAISAKRIPLEDGQIKLQFLLRDYSPEYDDLREAVLQVRGETETQSNPEETPASNTFEDYLTKYLTK